MRILITGGAGFIGHKVVLFLQQLGHDVYSCDSFTQAYVDFSLHNTFNKEVRSLTMHERVFNFRNYPIELDINRADEIYEEVKSVEPDIVIHLAGPANSENLTKAPQVAIESMTSGLYNTVRAVNLLVSRKPVKFVYISSNSVYNSCSSSTREFTMTEVPYPLDLFGHYTMAGELMVRQILNAPFTILRICNVYGPSNFNVNTITDYLINAMYGVNLYVNLQKIEDFIYIEDCAYGIVQAALSAKTTNATYNISSGKVYSHLQIAEIVKKITGNGVINIRTMLTNNRLQLNIERAQRDFEFNPAVELEEGIKETWLWMQQKHLIRKP